MTVQRCESIGTPIEGEPDNQLDQFKVCPHCGQKFDCRDLAQVMEHMHGEEMPSLDSAAPGS